MPGVVVGCGLPVMAPLDTEVGRIGVTDTGRGDILPIGKLPGVSIHLENRLVHGVEQVEVVTCRAIQLPQNAVFAHGLQRLLVADISKYSFEADLHIDGLTGNMLKVPNQFPCFGSHGQCGVGV